MEILSEVADQRGLLCSVFSDTLLSFSLSSFCIFSLCECVQMPESVNGCVSGQKKHDTVSSLFVFVADTDCLHLCKYTHLFCVRATVNKLEPLHLIKALCLMASLFTYFSIGLQMSDY